MASFDDICNCATVVIQITTLGQFVIFYDITDHERHGFLPIIE